MLCLDSRGLLLADRPGLMGHKRSLAVERSVVAGWSGGEGGSFGLLDTVRNFEPTVLVGMSGQAGAFDEEIVRTMLAACPRPVVLPLSNPNSRAEAAPADLLRWTRGAAVVATGSPYPPVAFGGETYEIGQANNVLVFPGIGLGAIAVDAERLPDEVFLAAARALGEVGGGSTHPGAPLFPPLGELRVVSRAVASAVARTLVEVGAAPPLEQEEIERRISQHVWEPEYLPYRPADG